ncbi:hypothetical protein Golob_012857 [Gossypium lobatum]|uniref:Uncharacterized protein n=1 Tax=Gossypium lobatum TaxID=34289 RepID=A0A7J8LMP0_9ROSI|nr:hypothetical protein [Gossypium lobatum]
MELEGNLDSSRDGLEQKIK